MGCSISATHNNSTLITAHGIVRNVEVEQNLHFEKSDRLLKKIILLGAADCGKSTVLKQMRLIYAEGFTDEELMAKRKHVIVNVFDCMVTILTAMGEMQIKFDEKSLEQDAAKIEKIVYCCKQTVDGTMEESAADAMRRLWANKQIQEVYERRNEYQLSDCAKYFLDDIDRIGNPKYMPTVADILRYRMLTTDVVQMSFFSKSLRFNVVDVGGLRSERRKWVHHFENCKAVIFVTSLSEYDQFCIEDEKTNRAHESLMLFENVCKTSFFAESAIILFLNKRDLFEEKIKQVPLTICFETYSGPQDYESCYKFIEDQFLAVNTNESKRIYPHATCAIDTNQFQAILYSNIETLIHQNLKALSSKLNQKLLLQEF